MFLCSGFQSSGTKSEEVIPANGAQSPDKNSPEAALAWAAGKGQDLGKGNCEEPLGWKRELFHTVLSIRKTKTLHQLGRRV